MGQLEATQHRFQGGLEGIRAGRGRAALLDSAHEQRKGGQVLLRESQELLVVRARAAGDGVADHEAGDGMDDLQAARQWQTSSLQSRSEEHTSELQSRGHLVCRLLLEKK